LGTDFECNTGRQGVKADRQLGMGQGTSRNSCKMCCQKKKGDNKFASLHGKRQQTKGLEIVKGEKKTAGQSTLRTEK